MRKYICLFISLILFSITVSAQQSTMVFDKHTFNFGTIEEQGGVVSHTFTFVNKGTTPFVIENVATSCGCTTPEYPRQPIRPNQSAKIKISYNPAGRPGRFSRDVIIVSNGHKNRNTLTIKGVVNPREKSIEDEFPYQVDGGLRLNSLMANFGYIEQGESRSMVIAYANPTDKPMKVSVASVSGAPAFNVVAYPSTLGPGEKGSLTLTYDIIDPNCWGYISDKFYVVVDGKKNHIPITTNGCVVEDFAPQTAANKKLAPEALMDQVYFDLGNMKSNTYTRSFTIANTGASPLIIRHVELPAGFTSSLKDATTIAVGQKKEFTFTVDVSRQKQMYLEKEIVLIMNVPSRAMRKIRVIGYK